tara:strand:+ start:66 stop:245 length:180 start_codon:yes stop_codon:yes gene_type:complete
VSDAIANAAPRAPRLAPEPANYELPKIDTIPIKAPSQPALTAPSPNLCTYVSSPFTEYA